MVSCSLLIYFSLLLGLQVPLSMVEPHDAVLIKSDSTTRYYSTQLGLRFKMEPHLLLYAAYADHLELTCISRVGLRKGGDALIESRAKWLVRLPASSTGIRMQAAPVAGSTVDHWPGQNDDDDMGGGRKIGISKEDVDDGDIQVGNQDESETILVHSDGSAQSISDSENPSRRTQPVVGSHPGRKL